MHFSAPSTLTLALLALLVFPSRGITQVVDKEIAPWDLVRTFLTETASPRSEVDRTAFSDRLSGELSGTDPRLFEGRWPAWVDVRIDTTAELAPRIEQRRELVDDKPVVRVDTFERMWVAASTWLRRYHGEAYFFLERDSIWRITAIRELPSSMERTLINRRAENVQESTDFSTVASMLNLLHSDADQITRFLEIASDASGVSTRLLGLDKRLTIDPVRIDTERLDPYFGLDDERTDDERMLLRMNLSSLDRIAAAGMSSLRFGSDSTVRFELARLQDRSVGYLWATDQKRLPDLAPDGVFLLRSVGDGWYLYKGFLPPAEATVDLAGLIARSIASSETEPEKSD